MARRSRKRTLGSAPARHRRDSARDYEVAQRTATLAIQDAEAGRCRDAYRHALMAEANYAAGSAHAVSISDASPYVSAHVRDLAKLVNKATGIVGRSCIR